MRFMCIIFGLWFSTSCLYIENVKAGPSTEIVATESNAVEKINEFQFLDASVEEEFVNEIPFEVNNSPEANSSLETVDITIFEYVPQQAPKKIEELPKSSRSISSVSEKTEKIRQEHAKELLGYKKFKKSSYAKSLKSEDFREDLIKCIELRLGANKKLAKKIQKAIFAAAKKYRFDPIFIAAIIQTESSFDPKARGTSGEVGLMQLMPDTASWIAQKEKVQYKNKKSLENPVTNIELGVAYMAFLRDYFKKNPSRYIAAYNMGAQNVKKLIAESRKPKTYSIRVLKNYKSLYANLHDFN